MRGLVGMQVQFSLASFVSVDTDAAPKSRTAHSRDRYLQAKKMRAQLL